jgi:hypothetical protein
MILHRQGTHPRLIDSSEHSSINLNLRKRNSSEKGLGFRKVWIGRICIECRCRPFGDLRRRSQFGGGEDGELL